MPVLQLGMYVEGDGCTDLSQAFEESYLFKKVEGYRLTPVRFGCSLGVERFEVVRGFVSDGPSRDRFLSCSDLISSQIFSSGPSY